jgi:adenylate cyclase
MGLFIFIAFFLIFWTNVYPSKFDLVFSAKVAHPIPPLILFGISGYYACCYYIFRYFEQKNIRIYGWLRYATSLVETSIPACFMIMFATVHIPADVVLSSRILLFFLFIILSALFLDEKICIFTGLVAGLEYFCVSTYFLHISDLSHANPFVFDQEQVNTRSFVFFLGGCLTAFVTQQIKYQLLSAFEASKDREKITNIFGRHVSPEVVNMLLYQEKNQISDANYVCVLFLDIRGFTSFSEHKKPEEVVRFLNQMFTVVVDIINAHHGIVNKFLGDGLMAVFGAPLTSGNDTDNAVNAAEEILIQIEHEIAAGNLPSTRVGIGVHCGMAVTGNIGASNRQEYTIIGDVVNLASRIEKLNKQYSSQLLISEDVHQRLEVPRGRLLGDVPVVGRDKSIKVYQLK